MRRKLDTAYRISGYGVSDLLGTAYWATPVRCFVYLGYGVLGYSGTVFRTSWVRRIGLLQYGVLAESVLFWIFDQSIIYDIYTDVDAAYSSTSCNGLLIRQNLGYYDESNTLVLERFNTSAGNLVKKILLKLNLPDHRSILTDLKIYIKMDMERRSVKVKELRERCIIKAFKLSYQEKYEHVGPKSQDYKMARLLDDIKRLWLMISRSSRSHSFQVKDTSQSLKVKDHYINSQVND
ncbi:hypothetical protein Tco_0450085 [Tanacetum coccineum]